MEYVVEIFPVAHGKTAPPRAAQANTQPPFFLESRNGAANDKSNGKIGARAKPERMVPRIMAASECPLRTKIKATNPNATDAV